MKKIKVLSCTLPLACVSLAAISPAITSCAKEQAVDKVKRIQVSLSTQRQYFLVGDTIEPTSFVVTAIHESGAMDQLAYDHSGVKGFAIDEEASAFKMGHTFTKDDLCTDKLLRFRFNNIVYDWLCSVDYSENVSLKLRNVNLVSMSDVVAGHPITIEYKTKTNKYYTSLEDTTVEFNGNKFNAYDEYGGNIKLEVEESNDEDKIVKMTVNSSIVTSNTTKIEIATDNYEDTALIRFKHDRHCSLEGYDYMIVESGTRWEDVVKPTVTETTIGYAFEKWVDENGTQLKPDDLITKNITATATCTDKVVEVTFEGVNCTVNPTSKLIPSGQTWKDTLPLVTVTPASDLYNLKKWVDANGNEIALDTKITGNFKAKAVCEKVPSITITFNAEGQGTLKQTYKEIPSQRYTWADFKEEFDTYPVPAKDWLFCRWEDPQTHQEVNLGKPLNENFTVNAVFVPQGDWKVSFAPVENSIRSLHLDGDSPMSGKIKRTSLMEGWEKSGPKGFKQPVWDAKENSWYVDSPHKSDDFRMITQNFEVTIEMPPMDPQDLIINFKHHVYMSCNARFMAENNLTHTVEVFNMGTDPNKNPEFYADLYSTHKDFDACSVNQIKLYHDVFFAAKSWTDDRTSSLHLQLFNPKPEPVTVKYYVGVSYLIHDYHNDFNGDQNGNCKTRFEWTLGKQ